MPKWKDAYPSEAGSVLNKCRAVIQYLPGDWMENYLTKGRFLGFVMKTTVRFFSLLFFYTLINALQV
ncbi:hypothetical protein IQ283_06865 [Alkalihalobacillus hwajinpoensis]|nr:hypothetical protein [Pseudalkalibacillus hwajinpoensis]